jgi:hypothetical protein
LAAAVMLPQAASAESARNCRIETERNWDI